jgi:DNA replication protein DnaC
LNAYLQPARFDHEYERNGTANLFMMFAPLEGWRHVKVKKSYADAILDRLVHNAHRIELEGESMRRTRAKQSRKD